MAQKEFNKWKYDKFGVIIHWKLYTNVQVVHNYYEHVIRKK